MTGPPTGAPLAPGPEEARSLLREELVHPRYHEQDLLGRILRGLARLLREGVEAAAAAPPLTTLAAMVVLVVLVLGTAALLSRARRSGRGHRAAVHDGVLPETVPAAELRRRAAAALTAGDHAAAVLDGFRALAREAVDQGLLDERPGLTAAEVATTLAALRPNLAGRLHDTGRLFDAVRYGHRSASADQARAVLDLGEQWAVPR